MLKERPRHCYKSGSVQVLILILMEYAQRAMLLSANNHSGAVLILILMEYAQRAIAHWLIGTVTVS